MTNAEWTNERAREAERERQVAELNPIVAVARKVFLKFDLGGLTLDEYKVEKREVEEWQQEGLAFLYTRQGQRVLMNFALCVNSKGRVLKHPRAYLIRAIRRYLQKILLRKYGPNDCNLRKPPPVTQSADYQSVVDFSRDLPELLKGEKAKVRNHVLAKAGIIDSHSKATSRTKEEIKEWARKNYPQKDAQILLHEGSKSKRIRSAAWEVMKELYLENDRKSQGCSVLFAPIDGELMLWGPMCEPVWEALGRRPISGVAMLGLKRDERAVLEDPKLSHFQLVEYRDFAFKNIVPVTSTLETTIETVEQLRRTVHESLKTALAKADEYLKRPNAPRGKATTNREVSKSHCVKLLKRDEEQLELKLKEFSANLSKLKIEIFEGHRRRSSPALADPERVQDSRTVVVEAEKAVPEAPTTKPQPGLRERLSCEEIEPVPGPANDL